MAGEVIRIDRWRDTQEARSWTEDDSLDLFVELDSLSCHELFMKALGAFAVADLARIRAGKRRDLTMGIKRALDEEAVIRAFLIENEPSVLHNVDAYLRPGKQNPQGTGIA